MSLSNNGFHALLSLFAADYSIDSAALDLYIGYQYLSPEIDLNRHRTNARGRALGDFDLLFTGRSHLLLGSSRERSTLRRTYCGPWKLPINVCRGLCRAGFRVSTCLDQSVLLARSRASPATCRSFQPLLSCDDSFADWECSISPHVGPLIISAPLGLLLGADLALPPSSTSLLLQSVEYSNRLN
jgi:hypothetical protein